MNCVSIEFCEKLDYCIFKSVPPKTPTCIPTSTRYLLAESSLSAMAALRWRWDGRGAILATSPLVTAAKRRLSASRLAFSSLRFLFANQDIHHAIRLCTLTFMALALEHQIGNPATYTVL